MLEIPSGKEAGFCNEPLADFEASSVRATMERALKEVEAELGQEVPLVISGRREKSDRQEKRLDPSNLSACVARVQYGDAARAERAMTVAASHFAAWRDTPVATRCRVLRNLAAHFRERRFYLAAWQVFEVGKTWTEADADVAEAIDFCEFYAAEMERLSVPRERHTPGETNNYFYEGRGPCVIIAPWNFPLAILTGMTVAALVAGNSVVMKPAEQASRVGYLLMEALEAAGLPPGVAGFLPGDGDIVGPALVSHPETAVISFTGSRAVGLEIMQQAAHIVPGQRHIKNVLAELGGKNCIIVDESADLDAAVAGVVTSSIGFAGQKCSAASRVVVVGSAYPEFCKRLEGAWTALRHGPAQEKDTRLGPVVDREARSRIEGYQRLGLEEARLLARAAVPQELREQGHFVDATVFVDCPPESRLWREEIFGPVLVVAPAPDLAAALNLAQDSDYNLTGGFYSRNQTHIERVRQEFRVGNLYINRKITGALVDRHPFGGNRFSGTNAKAGGPDYLLHFLTARNVSESGLRG